MRLTRGLALASAGLWLISLALPAIDGPGFPALSGYDVLRQGAGAWRDGVVAWYANPALAASLALSWLGRFRPGLALAAMSLALAVSSYWAGSTAESAGLSVPAFGYSIGFHVWLLAIAVAPIAAGTGLYISVARRPRP